MHVFSIRNSKHRKKDRQGVTTVEVAFTFPILMLLIMLVFEVSRMMMVQQCLSYAVEQGSRRASLATTLTQAEVESTTRNAMQVAIPENTSAVTVTVTPTMTFGMGSGTAMAVDAQVNLADVSWLAGNILHHFGNPTLSARAIQDRE